MEKQLCNQPCDIAVGSLVEEQDANNIFKKHFISISTLNRAVQKDLDDYSNSGGLSWSWYADVAAVVDAFLADLYMIERKAIPSCDTWVLSNLIQYIEETQLLVVALGVQRNNTELYNLGKIKELQGLLFFIGGQKDTFI